MVFWTVTIKTNSWFVTHGKKRKFEEESKNMNEEQLKELNLEETQVNSVMKLHKEAIDGNYVPKSRFNEINGELNQYKDDIKKRDEQLEELQKLEPEKLQERITELQQDNESQKEEFDKQMKQLKVDHALTTQLNQAKVKNNKAVAALLNLDDTELDENGLIKGLDEQLTKLKESDDYLFNSDDAKKLKGAQPGKQKQEEPAGGVDFSKMSYAEIDAWMKENN